MLDEKTETTPSSFEGASASCGSHAKTISKEEEKEEWDDVRCTVCLEHPHNAVLLLCSSHERGCRPYMCDTSYRHSNCLDRFHKAFSSDTPSPSPSPSPSPICLDQLFCPLCRGHIKGWGVVEKARSCLDAKLRGCANESCGFRGSYEDLRVHARAVHPLVRPSEVDPERERIWRSLEHHHNLNDVLSTIMPGATMLGDYVIEGGAESEEDLMDFPGDEGNGWNVFVVFQVFSPVSGTTVSRATRRRPRRIVWVRGDDEDEESAPQRRRVNGEQDEQP
ncbi:hypothetical protein AMTRI_Chr03g46810 [Amborella trichopoda]